MEYENKTPQEKYKAHFAERFKKLNADMELDIARYSRYCLTQFKCGPLKILALMARNNYLEMWNRVNLWEDETKTMG